MGYTYTYFKISDDVFYSSSEFNLRSSSLTVFNMAYTILMESTFLFIKPIFFGITFTFLEAKSIQ